MYIRRYSAPLTVLAAGVLGFSLICIVSAAALTSPMTPNGGDIEAQDIMDSAFSNPISTAVAMTVVEITAYIPSPTSSLVPSSPTISPLGTPTPRTFITWTPPPPTRTRDGRLVVPTSTRVPFSTPTRVIPTATRIIPTFTHTEIPDTNTPRPTQTDTPEPPTDTPEPPTDTPAPPTDTPEPPTDTPEPPTDTPEPPTTEPPPTSGTPNP